MRWKNERLLKGLKDTEKNFMDEICEIELFLQTANLRPTDWIVKTPKPKMFNKICFFLQLFIRIVGLSGLQQVPFRNNTKMLITEHV